MRTGITITAHPPTVAAAVLVKDRNAPQQRRMACRDRSPLYAGGAGTNAIMRQTGKAEDLRLALAGAVRHEGFEGLLADKTRISRIKPLGDKVAARIVALTLDDPPGETTH